MEAAFVQSSFSLLRKYVETENFQGWDPYDGLNSKIFQKLPFRNNSLARLAWIQFFKRSPINFRKLLKVDKEHNAKGLGLFLSGYCNLYQLDPREEYKEKIFYLAEKLEGLSSKGYAGNCWGYNFDWQARAFFQSKGMPTVVATTYVGYAFLDAYQIFHEKKWSDIARSSCDFILENLNRTYDKEGDFCFSYSPLDKTQVFNASLLGSRLLARTYSHTREEKLIQAAKQSVSFCCKMQRPDGAWSYGTLPFHQWIDNFHTGFNLECIAEYQKFSNNASYQTHLQKGLDYYLANFFTEKGQSKYYNNQLLPIDIHSPAQLVVTLFRIGKLNNYQSLVSNVVRWTIDHMQDSDGYFYYQQKRMGTSKIPYMRWAQAWMFFALTCYLKNLKDEQS